MVTISKIFILLGSINAFLAVAAGAFGAHALKGKLDPGMLATYDTAAHYHLIHALGLLVIGLLGQSLQGGALLNWAGWMMLAGIVLFSGSLYALSLSGIRGLGAITPVGGLLFLGAWLAVAMAAYRSMAGS